MTGPFYIKDSNEDYTMIEACKDCAFCDETDGVCILAQCIMFPEYEQEEK